MIIFFNLADKLLSIIKNIKENWLLMAILLVGIALRFVPINQYQFSHDELSGLSRTIFPNFVDEVNYGIKITDTHPALVQLFLWFWTKLFGFNEIAIKVPFLICGVFSIWYIYKFCKTFFDEKVGLIAATVVSLSFIFLVYSSYARMYITGVLFSILLLHIIFKILFSENVTRKDYFLFTLFAILCAYNHHMSCLFAVSVSVLTLFYIRKERLKNYLLFCLLAALLYLPHLSITLYQFSIGGIGTSSGGWLSAPRNNEIYFFVKTLLGCGITGKLNMVLFLALLLISIFKLIPLTKKQFFLLWIFLINYLIIHLYSVFKNPILQFSVLLFAGITLIIFLSSFAGWLTKKQTYWFVFILVTGFCFQSLHKKHIFSKVHVHDFEMQAKTTLDMQKRVGAKNVTSIFGSEKFFVYVYEKKFHTKFNYLSAQDSVFKHTDRFRAYLRNLKQPYIVIGGLSPVDMLLVKEYYPNLVSHEENYFSNVTVLSKRYYSNTDVSILNTISLLNTDLELYVDWKKPLTYYGDSLSYTLNQLDKKYPFNVKIPIQKTLATKNQYLVAELQFVCDSITDLDNDKLCLSVSEQGKDAVFYKAVYLKDYYNSVKKNQRVYIELFAGTEFSKWHKKNMNLEVFIEKQKKSKYTIFNFHLHRIDYNPTKWTLWD